MRFSDDEMWQAVVNCDESYDGQLFYAVKTVGVFCRPSCKSRTPLRKNVCYFTRPEDAQKAGFRPCKRCRPDLTDYRPVQDLTRQTKKLLDSYYGRQERLTVRMKQLGVSVNHLAVIFKQQYGLSPTQYLNQVRIEHVKKMLAETDMLIIDIAGKIGFDSLPAFYGFFKRNTGTTPRQYRFQVKGGVKSL